MITDAVEEARTVRPVRLRVTVKHALLGRVRVRAAARDERVGLLLARACVRRIGASDGDRAQRVELGPLAGHLVALGPVSAVPDPRSPDRRPVSVGGPGDLRQTALFPLVVETAEGLREIDLAPPTEVVGVARPATRHQIAVAG